MMRPKKVKAFTLVELLIAIMILSVVGVAIGFAVQGSLSTYQSVNEIADVNQAARVIMSRLGREIRACDNATFTGTETSNENTLTLNYLATDPIYPTTITYHINKSAGTMTRSEDSGSAITLIGGNDDPLSISGADFDITTQNVTIGESVESRPFLVKVFLEFEVGGVKYPFASSACPRKWVNEVRTK